MANQTITNDAQFALDHATCTLREYRAENPSATVEDYINAILEMLGWRKTYALKAEMRKLLDVQ